MENTQSNSELLYSWLADSIGRLIPDKEMAALLVNMLDRLVIESKIDGFSHGIED